jgi:trehalose-6-phosphatase
MKKKNRAFYGVRLYKKNLNYKIDRWTRGRKVIAVDFDGTLSMGKYPACGPANNELVALLKKLLADPSEARPYYVLWTSRTEAELENAVAWLREQGLVFDGVNRPPKETAADYTRKIWADLYVDDRAITPENFINSYKEPEEP